jgi:hypothetical protein
VAREETQQVVAEAGQQAKQLLRRTEQEVSDQAGAQQRRLAAGLHAVGEELASMAKGSATNGAATISSGRLPTVLMRWALGSRTGPERCPGGHQRLRTTVAGGIPGCCRRSWPPRRAADPRRQGRREYGQHLGEAARSRTGADDL